MSNHACEQDCPGRGLQPPAPGVPSASEPPVRRWPHPVNGIDAAQASTARQLDTALHYIHCALSYQNQLLADIKALLEQISSEQAEEK
ncbi:hypothetical protein [uncultured Dysosmobacter sp.]|uniref:hypothetical protein n=1 Tax=uncultured Dysosmobacter sp. TaxID=2591384 RepID=UPI002615F11C|nr:hypothetical protein [uncultured Dysosmobacter sp.]